MNIRVVVAYDGSGYHGFQRQKGHITVQDVIEQALEELTGRPTRIIGATRTDARAHAFGQVFNFRVKGTTIPPSRWAQALNTKLPATIRCLRSDRVRGAFHARYFARHKSYFYLVQLGPVPLPFLSRYALHVEGDPDDRVMEEAAKLFEGRRDFASFANTGSSQKSSQCHLMESQWVRFSFAGHSFLGYRVTADRFLYCMVRNLVGEMLQTALGEKRISDLEEMLANPTPRRKKKTAPSHGLYLVRVTYEEEDVG